MPPSPPGTRPRSTRSWPSAVPTPGTAGLAGPNFTTAPDPPADPEARRLAQEVRRKTERDEGRRLNQWWVDRMVLTSTPLRNG